MYLSSPSPHTHYRPLRSQHEHTSSSCISCPPCLQTTKMTGTRPTSRTAFRGKGRRARNDGLVQQRRPGDRVRGRKSVLRSRVKYVFQVRDMLLSLAPCCVKRVSKRGEGRGVKEWRGGVIVGEVATALVCVVGRPPALRFSVTIRSSSSDLVLHVCIILNRCT